MLLVSNVPLLQISNIRSRRRDEIFYRGIVVENCGVIGKKPRDRIIGTARELFRRYGLRGIGVDAIAEAAGTNKMTMYRHFRSKDELVVACLRDAIGEAEAFWDRFEADHPGDPLSQLRAWVQCCAAFVNNDGRGCDMANAAVELAQSDHPARRVIEEFKSAQRDRLAKLCRKARIADADVLADALSLLLEGARVSRQSSGAAGPCARFAAIGEAMIMSFSRADVDVPPRIPKRSVRAARPRRRV
jgi:AcrR family transcriptional regulator